jgi:molybdopterin-binding protein
MSIKAIDAKNQFPGKIRQINQGPVVSEIKIDTSVGVITSVITTRSLKDSGLGIGQEVLTLFKEANVSLAAR